jgi:hypothetical protein
VAQAAVWAQPSFARYAIINIANEWGAKPASIF